MQNLKEEREANPWGTKLIISVYFKGFVVEEGLDGVIDDIDQIFPESDFIGISSEVLYEEPKEQEGG